MQKDERVVAAMNALGEKLKSIGTPRIAGALVELLVEDAGMMAPRRGCSICKGEGWTRGSTPASIRICGCMSMESVRGGSA